MVGKEVNQIKIKKFLVIFSFVFGITFATPVAISVNSGVASGVSFVELPEHTKQEAKRCLVEALYHEALNQSLEGKKAVLQVILNRKRTSGFPSTFCKVVDQPLQFSYRNNLKPGQRVQFKPKNSLDKKVLKEIESLVDQLISGEFTEVLNKNVLWYARSEIKRKWMRRMKVHTKIDSHSFYEKYD